MLEQDSEQQMISIAKKSYLTHAKSRNELPTSMDLFLIIKVNRNNLVSDSMNEISKKKADLKKKLRVSFIGEAAIDMGGVRKEWFLLLVRQIFSPLYGMFTYIAESDVHWFTTTVTHGMLAEYHLIGVLMGNYLKI
jgi:E3 ubiquitin-protein ligase HECTD2